MGHSAQRSKSSLFADEPFGGGNSALGSSSLFADDDGGSSSPWNNNTNKRTARHEIVKTLLPESDVPDNYIDAYDLVLSGGDRVGARVGLTSVREILSGSGLSASDQEKIFNLVVSGDGDDANGLGRSEFNVLLALVGLAQEGEDLTFDAVDDRRKSRRYLPFVGYLLVLLTSVRAPDSSELLSRCTACETGIGHLRSARRTTRHAPFPFHACPGTQLRTFPQIRPRNTGWPRVRPLGQS